MSPAASAPAAPSVAADTPPARERLLQAALQLFAEHGYAKTSIRAIAQAAQANVAAVSYYFGDKATLYAALFSESFGDMQPLVDAFSSERLSLREAMACYFGGMLEPLQHGERARQFMRLHIREMLEPTSQWEREMQASVRVPHEALVGLLARHLNLAASDDGLERLAFSISGLAMQVWCQQDVLIALRPQLLDAPDALQAWVHRLTAYALALVAAEAALRGLAPPPMPHQP
jgi:TetR/AcrR family transcriptional regulator, regulator of cefoperazone and chloramphenicol sensitivity